MRSVTVLFSSLYLYPRRPIENSNTPHFLTSNNTTNDSVFDTLLLMARQNTEVRLWVHIKFISESNGFQIKCLACQNVRTEDSSVENIMSVNGHKADFEKVSPKFGRHGLKHQIPLPAEDSPKCFLCQGKADLVCNWCRLIHYCSPAHYKHHRTKSKCWPFQVK